ncbi:MAG: meso-butanediol dehydrogenase/(S,S)-butanediol dehydrogenase/diacetyl reductase [Myxococcota bacterium]|jgi:meso-butanediol dehydrogenase/(S,S)-butanediol dehydrogenase/diacetyl reductase
MPEIINDTSTLEGKVGIVTGAGQGVGQGIALSLARHGAKVALMGRTLSKVEATQKRIEDRGGEALALEGDVKSLDDLTRCVEQTVSTFGGLQILVNNAQQVPLGPLIGISEEMLDDGWTSGPLATFRMMKLCYPHLKGDGSIINLASTAARRWDASNYGAYAAVKEAIRGFSRGAASEWGADNIRTNIIMPHAKSPGLEWWIDNNPEEAAAFIKSIPLGRIGECEDDIGEVAAFLCSKAAVYISGQTIAVDGGQAYMP